MKKKILIVDDSALMRRVLCDIISTDDRYEVADTAPDGVKALELITTKKYDGVILDVNMPRMTGVELLRELKKRRVRVNIMMASTETREGAALTIECLELGAIDFIHKPENFLDTRDNRFREKFLSILTAVCESHQKDIGEVPKETITTNKHFLDIVTRSSRDTASGDMVVALACSTGGPRALQYVIPYLPKELAAPVLIVQHMPQGFTKSLADRMNSISPITVSEAAEGDVLEAGHVYIARGGAHMKVRSQGGKHVIYYTDEPQREGVKPCANYMYESLIDSRYSKVLCVVLTGMGADGTEGIVNLSQKKKIHVIAQDEATSAVYGMPRSIAATGKADQVVALQQIAQEIIMNVGVNNHGC